MKTKWTDTKSWSSPRSEKKQDSVFEVTKEKNSDSNEANVSVFTKNRNSKVIVWSENLNNNYDSLSYQNRNKHKFIKFLCVMIMCLIVLMTFFLSLSTYNTINKLSHLLWL